LKYHNIEEPKLINGLIEFVFHNCIAFVLVLSSC